MTENGERRTEAGFSALETTSSEVGSPQPPAAEGCKNDCIPPLGCGLSNLARATLLAGGNLGDVARALERARAMVERRVGRIVEATSVKKNTPWGMDDAPDFLNQIWVVETPFAPEPLLDELERIERELGREKIRGQRSETYASRTMDIDILYYGDLRLESLQLTIPHPRIGERKFVLELLDELSRKG